MNEKIFEINKINICTESFGDSEQPAILLINGAMNTMVYWDEEFCQRLADTGRYVIRYDNRDVGRSTTFEVGTANYTVLDMASDAIGVLDSYNIAKAHLVGISLGGMISQVVAYNHPSRVLSITAISSSLFGSDENDRNLPSIDESLFAYHAKGEKLDWSDTSAVIDYLVEGSKILCGSRNPFDEARSRKLATQDVTRATSLLSMFNHAVLTGNDFYEDKIKQISTPALVIHGTEDKILPYEHGLALTQELPNATLLTLDGGGHELHFNDWNVVINALAAHTSSDAILTNLINAK